MPLVMGKDLHQNLEQWHTLSYGKRVAQIPAVRWPETFGIKVTVQLRLALGKRAQK